MAPRPIRKMQRRFRRWKRRRADARYYAALEREGPVSEAEIRRRMRGSASPVVVARHRYRKWRRSAVERRGVRARERGEQIDPEELRRRMQASSTTALARHRYRSLKRKRIERAHERARERGEVVTEESLPDELRLVHHGRRRMTLKQRWRRVKRSFRLLPMPAQIASFVVAGAAVIGIAFATAPQIVEQDALTGAYQEAAGRSNRLPRVLVVGDASAWQLAFFADGVYLDGRIRGSAFGMFECGIGGGVSYAGRSPIETSVDCDTWPEEYDKVTEAFQPDVVVLMTGTTESFTREVDGELLRPETPELEAHLRAQLDEAREVLTRTGGRLVVSSLPCPTLSDGRTPNPPRVWVNGLLKDYAAEHDLDVFDLDALACPDGVSARTPRGRPIIEGYGLTEAGANQVWKWLSDEIAGPLTPETTSGTNPLPTPTTRRPARSSGGA